VLSAKVDRRNVFRRVIWIVLDSVGIGEMPDAATYGDTGSDTLGNIARRRALRLPNLCRLGLGNIKPLEGPSRAAEPAGSFGRCALASPGKDISARIPPRDPGRIRAPHRARRGKLGSPVPGTYSTVKEPGEVALPLGVVTVTGPVVAPGGTVAEM